MMMLYRLSQKVLNNCQNKFDKNKMKKGDLKQLSIFEEKIGIIFKDKSLLRQAFTHRSYLNEHRDENIGHNERLEFLGDAVLELVITDYLYKTYPDKNEGELTAYRAALV